MKLPFENNGLWNWHVYIDMHTNIEIILEYLEIKNFDFWDKLSIHEKDGENFKKLI